MPVSSARHHKAVCIPCQSLGQNSAEIISEHACVCWGGGWSYSALVWEGSGRSGKSPCVTVGNRSLGTDHVVQS